LNKLFERHLIVGCLFYFALRRSILTSCRISTQSTIQSIIMKKILVLISLIISVYLNAQNITTRFEQSGGTQSPPYKEIVEWWQKLDAQSGKVKMLTMGMTDAGYPLHLIVVSNNGDYNFDNIHRNNKRVILINNGIHPGEPDGIDASMLLARDIVTNKYKIPDNIVLAIIPIYNIGGCLNRSANYRVDQNGPEEFGFRGNSQNLDLNRDFIKCDSKDARAFTEIFHLTDPDVFVDNHVSDGADYQHVMTLLSSQHNKLGGVMGDYLNDQFEPGLYSAMKQKGYDLVPYVNSFGDTPESGWPEYWDSPRYGSGYGTLWQTFSFA
jgi:Zinc carboxypeptidase